jgi:hypothetical protein
MYNSSYEEGSPVINNEYLESLVILLTISNNSFKYGDFRGSGARIVMIPSNNSANKSKYSY